MWPTAGALRADSASCWSNSNGPSCAATPRVLLSLHPATELPAKTSSQGFLPSSSAFRHVASFVAKRSRKLLCRASREPGTGRGVIAGAAATLATPSPATSPSRPTSPPGAAHSPAEDKLGPRVIQSGVVISDTIDSSNSSVATTSTTTAITTVTAAVATSDTLCVPSISSSTSIIQPAAPSSSTEAMEPQSRTVRLAFTVPSFNTQPGQRLVVVGGCGSLGSWQPARGLALKWHEGHRWSGGLEADVLDVQGVEFKVVMMDGRNGSVMWEQGRNRVLQVEGSAEQSVLCKWGKETSHLQLSTHSQQHQRSPASGPTSPPPGSLRARVQLVVPLYVGGPGQRLVVVGSVPELGAWDVRRGVELVCSPEHIWRGEVELPLGTMLEAKLVVLGPGSGEERWEAGPNRTLTLAPPPPEDLLLPPPLLPPPPPHASSSGCTSSAPSQLPPPPPPPPRTPTGVAGHYVVLCHWGIPGCSQALYRPDVDSEVETSAGSSDTLTDRQVLSLVHFTVPQFVTVPGQHLVLVGSVPALGSWNPSTGVQLKWGPGHIWSAELLLPPGQDVEAKVVYYDKGRYSWEPGPNRSLPLSQVLADSSPGAEPLFTCYWGHTPTSPVVVVPKRHPRDLPPELQPVEAEVVEEEGGKKGLQPFSNRRQQQQQQAAQVQTSPHADTGSRAANAGAPPSPEEDALLRFLVFMMSTFIPGGDEHDHSREDNPGAGNSRDGKHHHPSHLPQEDHAQEGNHRNQQPIDDNKQNYQAAFAASARASAASVAPQYPGSSQQYQGSSQQADCDHQAGHQQFRGTREALTELFLLQLQQQQQAPEAGQSRLVVPHIDVGTASVDSDAGITAAAAAADSATEATAAAAAAEYGTQLEEAQRALRAARFKNTKLAWELGEARRNYETRMSELSQIAKDSQLAAASTAATAPAITGTTVASAAAASVASAASAVAGASAPATASAATPAGPVGAPAPSSVCLTAAASCGGNSGSGDSAGCSEGWMDAGAAFAPGDNAVTVASVTTGLDEEQRRGVAMGVDADAAVVTSGAAGSHVPVVVEWKAAGAMQALTEAVVEASSLREMGPQALAAAVAALGLGAGVSPGEVQVLRELLRTYQAATVEFEGRAQRLGPVPSTSAKREVMSAEMCMREAREALITRLEALVVGAGGVAAATGGQPAEAAGPWTAAVSDEVAGRGAAGAVPADPGCNVAAAAEFANDRVVAAMTGSSGGDSREPLVEPWPAASKVGVAAFSVRAGAAPTSVSSVHCPPATATASVGAADLSPVPVSPSPSSSPSSSSSLSAPTWSESPPSSSSSSSTPSPHSSSPSTAATTEPVLHTPSLAPSFSSSFSSASLSSSSFSPAATDFAAASFEVATVESMREQLLALTEGHREELRAVQRAHREAEERSAADIACLEAQVQDLNRQLSTASPSLSTTNATAVTAATEEDDAARRADAVPPKLPGVQQSTGDVGFAAPIGADAAAGDAASSPTVSMEAVAAALRSGFRAREAELVRQLEEERRRLAKAVSERPGSGSGGAGSLEESVARLRAEFYVREAELLRGLEREREQYKRVVQQGAAEATARAEDAARHRDHLARVKAALEQQLEDSRLKLAAQQEEARAEVDALKRTAVAREAELTARLQKAQGRYTALAAQAVHERTAAEQDAAALRARAADQETRLRDLGQELEVTRGSVEAARAAGYALGSRIEDLAWELGSAPDGAMSSEQAREAAATATAQEAQMAALAAELAQVRTELQQQLEEATRKEAAAAAAAEQQRVLEGWLAAAVAELAAAREDHSRRLAAAEAEAEARAEETQQQHKPRLGRQQAPVLQAVAAWRKEAQEESLEEQQLAAVAAFQEQLHAALTTHGSQIAALAERQRREDASREKRFLARIATLTSQLAAARQTAAWRADPDDEQQAEQLQRQLSEARRTHSEQTARAAGLRAEQLAALQERQTRELKELRLAAAAAQAEAQAPPLEAQEAELEGVGLAAGAAATASESRQSRQRGEVTALGWDASAQSVGLASGSREAAATEVVAALRAQLYAARSAEAEARMAAGSLRRQVAEAEARSAALAEELEAARRAVVAAEAAVAEAVAAAQAAAAAAAAHAAGKDKAREAAAKSALEAGRLREVQAAEVEGLQEQISGLRTDQAAWLVRWEARMEGTRSEQTAVAVALVETRTEAEKRRAELEGLRQLHRDEVAQLRRGYEAQLGDRSRALHRALGLVAAMQAQAQGLQRQWQQEQQRRLRRKQQRLGSKHPSTAAAAGDSQIAHPVPVVSQELVVGHLAAGALSSFGINTVPRPRAAAGIPTTRLVNATPTVVADMEPLPITVAAAPILAPTASALVGSGAGAGARTLSFGSMAPTDPTASSAAPAGVSTASAGAASAGGALIPAATAAPVVVVTVPGGASNNVVPSPGIGTSPGSTENVLEEGNCGAGGGGVNGSTYGCNGLGVPAVAAGRAVGSGVSPVAPVAPISDVMVTALALRPQLSPTAVAVALQSVSSTQHRGGLLGGLLGFLEGSGSGDGATTDGTTADGATAITGAGTAADQADEAVTTAATVAAVPFSIDAAAASALQAPRSAPVGDDIVPDGASDSSTQLAASLYREMLGRAACSRSQRQDGTRGRGFGAGFSAEGLDQDGSLSGSSNGCDSGGNVSRDVSLVGGIDSRGSGARGYASVAVQGGAAGLSNGYGVTGGDGGGHCDGVSLAGRRPRFDATPPTTNAAPVPDMAPTAAAQLPLLPPERPAGDQVAARHFPAPRRAGRVCVGSFRRWREKRTPKMGLNGQPLAGGSGPSAQAVYAWAAVVASLPLAVAESAAAIPGGR